MSTIILDKIYIGSRGRSEEEEANRAIETVAEVERQDCGDTINRDALGMVRSRRQWNTLEEGRGGERESLAASDMP